MNTNKATHVVVKFTSAKMDLLYRVEDGMSIACRSEITVIVGTVADPARMLTHKFLTEPHARAYLNRIADLDLNELPLDGSVRTPREQLTKWAEVDERFGDTKIIQPGSALGLKY